jgi:hypothetical protein
MHSRLVHGQVETAGIIRSKDDVRILKTQILAHLPLQIFFVLAVERYATCPGAIGLQETHDPNVADTTLHRFSQEATTAV